MAEAPEPTRMVEPIWLEPYPDALLEERYEARESIELSFIVALQRLPPRQRAALVLADVLGYRNAEIAEMLDAGETAIKGTLQRARATLRPGADRDRATRPDSAAERRLVASFADAVHSGDVDAVVALLAEDAAWSMPPMATWYRGHALAVWLREWPLSGEWRWRHVRAHANGQPAVASYTWDEEAGVFRAFCLNVLTFSGPLIADVTSFIVRTEPPPERLHLARWPDQPPDTRRLIDFFERFGLPTELD